MFFYFCDVLTNVMYKFLAIVMIGLFLSGCKSDQNSTHSASSDDPEISSITNDILKNPTNAQLYFERGKIYYNKASYDLAILDIRKAMTIDSLNPEFYHLLSDSYLDYYNSKEAVNTMLKVLTLYPERVPSLLKMAELKYILEDYDSSILTVNEVVRIDPSNAEAFFMLGLNFRAIGDKERAISSFQTAVEMNSTLTDAWIILGEMYEEKKDPRALKYFESAIFSNPKSMQALHSKAFYLQNHGNIPGALEIYRTINLSDKTYMDAYLNAGLLYLELDSIDRAFEQFDIMTGMAPTNYMGFYMRGIVNEKKGKKEDALRDYESASHLNKDDKKVQDAIASIKSKK
ncbi:MAG: tetratricopeptide repeat protein [Saprospiraceae bacterium]|nr:tetratricopeptide repeat protein [Saprospiraceae bacterium]